ncbi:response regulator [Rhodovulum sp. P5]|uniref:response regulator n=1 Tax=Rhodovulum sp. P5 TaxID=1564506 RepID=UPI001C12CE93|nr:response regulator [Rhodovulum sp. P5]
MARVLILEDEAVIGAHLQMMLERAGHEMMGYHNSCDSALAALALARPDVAILDVSLRGNGTSETVAERLVAMGVPFLFLSGRPPVAVPALAAYADAPWLSKPTDAQRLIATISELLGP